MLHEDTSYVERANGPRVVLISERDGGVLQDLGRLFSFASGRLSEFWGLLHQSSPFRFARNLVLDN